MADSIGHITQNQSLHTLFSHLNEGELLLLTADVGEGGSCLRFSEALKKAFCWHGSGWDSVVVLSARGSWLVNTACCAD